MRAPAIKHTLVASFAVALMVSVGAAPARASVLASFPLNANYTATNLAANVASATIDTSTLSDAYIGNDGFGNVAEMYPNNSGTSAALALATDSYFTLNISSNGGPLNLGVLNFSVAKGGSSDPRGYAIYDSLDGFASALFATQLPTGVNTAPAPESLSLGTDFQSATDVSFRFYVYTPQPQYNSVDFSNISLATSTGNSVPEPGALSLMGVGIACLGLLMMRRGTRRA
jgi:hypothetical protein